MVKRIRQLMEYKGLTSTQLADSIEVPRAVMSHILSERNKPSLDVVQKILSHYRDISMRWLLLSEGEMLINLASATKPRPVEPPAVQAAAASQASAQPEPTPVEKVQEPVPAANASPANDKAIEQIMVFYTDKTFIAYNPS
jgi:transcriptional regulator with XRE-family HTH domain